MNSLQQELDLIISNIWTLGILVVDNKLYAVFCALVSLIYLFLYYSHSKNKTNKGVIYD